MKETQRHKDAFEFYYRSRNVEATAREFTVSSRALHTWKKLFNWEDRCVIRDREVQAGLEKKMIPELVAERARLIKGLKDMQQITLAGIYTAFARDPKTGALMKDAKGNPVLTVGVERVRDLGQLIELAVRLTEAELKALGEPERSEVRVIEVKYDEAIERSSTETPTREATSDTA